MKFDLPAQPAAEALVAFGKQTGIDVIFPADELARVIADQPVLSREPGLMQAIARRVRRHPVAAGLLAIAVCGLVASTIVAALQSARARAERDLAVNEAARSERMARFLTSLFESVRPGENGGRTPSIEDLLERGQQQLERDTADDPELRIRLALTLADSWRALGQYERAGTLLERLRADAAATAVEPALAARIQMVLVLASTSTQQFGLQEWLMNRASLPPTLASRLQLRLTRNTQMQPLRRYRSSRASLCLLLMSSPA